MRSGNGSIRTPRKPFNAGWGWAGLAVYVLAYDTWALARRRDTLSTVFRRSLAHPIRRWPVVVTSGITILHLYGRIPAFMDPFHQYGVLLSHFARPVKELLT